MTSRKLAPRSLIPWLVILGTCCCAGEKLAPNQKAPPFARGSGGLILNTPYDDNKARNRPISNANTPQVDDVQREETDMLKLVNGEPVRSVQGSFSYKSPEGLPISVQYEADENGNRASFKFGAGSNGASSRQFGQSGQSGQSGSRGDQGGRVPNQGSKGSKSSSYPSPKDVDRSYLPPQ